MPYERDLRDLSEINFKLTEKLRKIQSKFMSKAKKPVYYRIIDSDFKRNYKGGIREYSDRFVIWFNPLAKGMEYTLAHEYGHGITMNDPTFPFLDPRLIHADDKADREVAGLAASIVDHPLVHRTINDLGFDPGPECILRTRETTLSLTKEMSSRIANDIEKGNTSKLWFFPFMCAEMLTTYRCEETEIFEKKFKSLLHHEILDQTFKIVKIIESRTEGKIDGHIAAVQAVEVIKRPDLKRFFVSREEFKASLRPWAP